MGNNKLKTKTSDLMKFAALLATAAAELQADLQDAASFLAACDTTRDNKLSLAELKACVNKYVHPASEAARTNALFEQNWGMLDTSGDGFVDEAELAVMLG